MTIKCPNCSKPPKRRHCASPYCNWYMCPCKATAIWKWLVFDKKDRTFLSAK